MYTWILLIMIYTGSTEGGIHTQMVEYKTQRACEQAAKQITTTRKEDYEYRAPRIKTKCFKGPVR